MAYKATVDKIITFFVIVLFLVAGIAKLYPIFPEFYRDAKMKFLSYAQVCPTVYLGYTPNPNTYRIVVALWEIFCAAAMLLSCDLRPIASITLTLIMCGAVYTHIATDDLENTAVPFVVMCLCFYLYYINSRYGRGPQPKVKTQ